MQYTFLQKGLNLLLKRQTNILSAALVLMATVILSQVLGLFRQRLLAGIFGASDTLGVYLVSSKLPDFLFQLIIAGALSSAFIPVFSDLLHKGRGEDANKMASTLMLFGSVFFAESMFHRQANASKVALYHLVTHLRSQGFMLLECQFMTTHLHSLGAVEIPESAYMDFLGKGLSQQAFF